MSTVYGVSATLGALALGLLIVAGLGQLGSHARASTAADLAAISGATALGTGNAEPCEIAAHIARANAAELRDCAVSGPRVEVTVSTGIRQAMAAAETD